MGGTLALFLCFGVVAGRVALRGVCVVFFVLAFGLVMYPSSVLCSVCISCASGSLNNICRFKKKKSQY
jgi:hypothetical protein